MKNSNFAIENHKNNMKIGIITAMSSEQKQLANQLRDNVPKVPLTTLQEQSRTIQSY